VSQLATVELEHAGTVVIGRIVGEVDASNAAQIQRRLLEGIGNEGIGLVVDLTQTNYLDSAGIRILFETGERLKMRGMSMRVVATPESFTADVLTTVGMTERFPVDTTVELAAAAVSGQPDG
jgi:anti-anti-sigma factor